MMVEDRVIQHNKTPEELAELQREAMAELERRGYDVRGKHQPKFDRYLSDRLEAEIKRKTAVASR